MNRPPKNMISCTRKSHIPRVDGVLLLLEVVEVVREDGE